MTEASPSALSADYYPLGSDDPGEILSPVPFRDETSIFNEDSERLFFEEDMMPSREESARFTYHRPRRAELNGINLLNVVTYVAHLFVSWGIGVWGLNGLLETRWEISVKYETLITPATWAHYFWYPILILEAVFTLAQLFPYYRARPIIQDGTKYFFFYVFVIQTAWTLFFSFQLFIFSFISVVGALVSLISLLYSQRQSLIGHQQQSVAEYILFQFPFQLHAGWMVLMVVDHFSILFRRYDASVGLQVAIDVFALGIMCTVAIACLCRPPHSELVLPAVILWSYVSVRQCLTKRLLYICR